MLLQALISLFLVSTNANLSIPPNTTPSPAQNEIPLPVIPQPAHNSVLFPFINVAEASTTVPEIIEPINEETCVSWVRKRIIKQFPRVAEAKDLIPTSDKPDTGSIVIFSYKPAGHLAKVVKVNRDSFEIEEYGFRAGTTTRRTINNNDMFLIGFWR